jgi:NAD(P)-dependent dehydrogenase (short-subunit alcohol dehydrogenase family)
LAQRLGRLDVLVNNAAIDYDTDAHALTIDLDRVRRDLETNLLGAWRCPRERAWACLLPDDGPTGGFFRDGQPLPW